MVYVRRSSRSTKTAPRTYKRSTSYRKPRTAVARIQKRKYTPKIVKNTQSVYKLAKQVSALEKKSIGQYQKNFQMAAFPLANGAYPFAFCVNDMHENTPIYEGQWDPTRVAPLDPAYATTVTTFHIAPDVAANAHGGEYSFWTNCNNDDASTQYYLPLSTTLRFILQLQGMPPKQRPIRIRIDLVRQKLSRVWSAANKLHLPAALIGLQDLVTDPMDGQGGKSQNWINKQHFEVFQTKFIKLYNNTDSPKDVQTFCQMNFKFPNQVLKLDGSAMQPLTGPPIKPTFIQQVPVNKRIWCLISTSSTSAYGTNVHTPTTQTTMTCSINRVVRFRDNSGVAS